MLVELLDHENDMLLHGRQAARRQPPAQLGLQVVARPPPGDRCRQRDGTTERRRASIGAVTVVELWRRGQVGWPRSFPVVQFPNPPLLLALAGWGVAAATGGTAHNAGRWAFMLGLVVWAWKETTGGVNWFRRLLGAGALIWLAFTLAGEL